MEATVLSSITVSERTVSTAQVLRRAADAVLVTAFLAVISLPLLGVRLGHHGWDIQVRAENRAMASEPTLLHLDHAKDKSARGMLKALAHFPGEFKYYFADHFGFRSLLIRAHGTLMVNGLGVTSNPSVILGKQGWLYLAGEGSVEDWRNIDPLTSVELEQLRQMFEQRQEFCRQRGIPYLLVIAPSKHDIYPQFMPDNLTKVGKECRLDQLLNYLRASNSSVQVLDLRDALLAARDRGVRLFQKTDTHWNDRGAWIAYQAIISRAQRSLPRLQALPADNFVPNQTIRPGMDLAGLLGLNDEFAEQSLDLTPRIALRLPHVQQNDVEPITVPDDGSNRPRIVVFRDSFMTTVLPYVAQSFGRGIYFWEDGFDGSVVDAEHPDIVIQELAQRKLMLPARQLQKVQPVRLINGKWMREISEQVAKPAKLSS